MDNINDLYLRLYCKNNSQAYSALKALVSICQKESATYGYFEKYFEMLESDNSYLRTRGIVLIAVNTKWDFAQKFEKSAKKYYQHICDNSPITARRCIALLPEIATNKPLLKAKIISALKCADTTKYNCSMQPLIKKDISEAINKINLI